jgi:rfaE bifunctional protein nucleotidyltransferase chain/domain
VTDRAPAIPAAVLAAIDARREAGDRVVFTNGCFDLLHPGHIASLRAARALGDLLVVGVNSDNSVCELKGSGRPVLPAAARAELLRELRCVDFVVVFEGDTPVDLIWELRPDVYVKGADWRDRPLAEADLVRDQGGEIAFIDRVSDYSTSAIIESIRAVPLNDGETPDAD